MNVLNSNKLILYKKPTTKIFPIKANQDKRRTNVTSSQCQQHNFSFPPLRESRMMFDLPVKLTTSKTPIAFSHFFKNNLTLENL